MGPQERETEEEDTASGGESETEEQYFSVTCDPSLGADGDAGSFGFRLSPSHLKDM